MKISTLFFGLFFLLILSACKNDLNINAPYKEIPSIYAILDPTEPQQTIRINKVFLGEGDANQMAKVADSINYPENELDVRLVRYVSGARVQASASRPNFADSTDIVFTEKVLETQPGSFNTNQRVYVTNHKLFDNGEYRLTVTNKHTGNVFKAKANALTPVNLGTFKPLGELPNYPYPGTTNNDKYIDYSRLNPSPPYEIKYTINSAYAYQLIIRYHIVDSLVGQASEILADYNAGVRTMHDVQKIGGGTISFVSHTFGGGGIYSTLANEMAKHSKDIIGRRVKYLEYIVYNSAIEYSDYLDYIKPSFGINQNKPLYSNFENSAALGLFTFRTKISVTKQISTDYMNALAENPSTCQYLFFNQFWKVGCK